MAASGRERQHLVEKVIPTLINAIHNQVIMRRIYLDMRSGRQIWTQFH